MVVYRLSAVLNYAVEKGLLEKSPMTYIKVSERIKKQFNEKVYLTKDELKRLMDTQCPVLSRPQVKQAYLLACFTGLQYGDIAGLMWKDIKPGEHGDTIPMLSRKTRAPLSDIAKRWLPDVKDKRLQVFKGLPSDVRFSQILQEWAAKAGVTKKLNFIIARNTFIYMLLTTGTTLATLAQIMNFTGVHRKYRLIEYAKMAGIQLSSREEISDYITTNYNL